MKFLRYTWNDTFCRVKLRGNEREFQKSTIIVKIERLHWSTFGAIILINYNLKD